MYCISLQCDFLYSFFRLKFAANNKKMERSFVLHDETVNTHGFRMLTAGVNLEEFRKNPVMILNHDDFSLPIGRWENIRIEGSRILADPVFDMKDMRAAEVARKVEDDFIRMASIGAWPPEEVSDAYSLMLPGQSLPTVTKWTVREASIVTIGANHNALAFYDRKTKERIDLTDKKNVIRLMDFNNQNNIKMSILTGLLNLQDTANETEIAAKVREIIANSDRLSGENKTLKDAIDKINKEKKETQKAEAITLVDAAIKDCRIDAKGRDAYLAFFDRDFEGAKTALAAIPVRTPVAPRIQTGGTSNVSLADLQSKTWDELDKANRLLELRDNYPDLYKEKFKQRFGVEPTNV